MKKIILERIAGWILIALFFLGLFFILDEEMFFTVLKALGMTIGCLAILIYIAFAIHLITYTEEKE